MGVHRRRQTRPQDCRTTAVLVIAGSHSHTTVHVVLIIAHINLCGSFHAAKLFIPHYRGSFLRGFVRYLYGVAVHAFLR